MSPVVSPSETSTHHYNLPFVGPFSITVERKIRRLIQRFCRNLDIKLFFSPYKFRNLFSVKDTVPKSLRSRVVYKFSCADCDACYVGETNRHLATRIREHLSTDKNSHIFQHLLSSDICQALCSNDCFSNLDTASTSFQHKINEALHIHWGKPSLNKQIFHVNLSLAF